jgi:hypothetical protein
VDEEYVQEHSLIEHRTTAREKLTQRDCEGSRCTELADQRGADDGGLFSYQHADGCRDRPAFCRDSKLSRQHFSDSSQAPARMQTARPSKSTMNSSTKRRSRMDDSAAKLGVLRCTAMCRPMALRIITNGESHPKSVTLHTVRSQRDSETGDFQIIVAIRVLTAVAALIAAALWLRSALIDVPDNIDTIIGELQRIGCWNSMAAFASCVAAFFAALDLLYETLLR